MKLLVTNIAYLCGTDTKRPTRLCGAEMQRFEVTERAYLLIENGRFASFARNGTYSRHADRGRGH